MSPPTTPSVSSSASPQEREQAAATFRALQDDRPLTLEEALDFGLLGWNLRCGRCGSFGAEWIQQVGRMGNTMAFCPPHRDEIRAEQRRHTEAMHALTAERFRQPPQHEVDQAWKVHRKARRRT